MNQGLEKPTANILTKEPEAFKYIVEHQCKDAELQK